MAFRFYRGRHKRRGGRRRFLFRRLRRLRRRRLRRIGYRI